MRPELFTPGTLYFFGPAPDAPGVKNHLNCVPAVSVAMPQPPVTGAGLITTATPGPGSVGGGSTIGGSIGGPSGGIIGPPSTDNPSILSAPMNTAGTA